MTFTPLTKEQYQKAINAGFSPQQIIQNEQQRKQADKPITNTSPTSGGGFWSGVGNIAKGIGNFVSNLPGKQIGEDIGTLAGYGITAGKEALGMAPKGSTKAYDLSAPTPGQAIGDVAKGAALIGGLSAAPETLLGSAATFGGVGALQAGGEALSKGNTNLIDIAKKSFYGGLTGAVVGGVGFKVGEGIQTLVEKAPEAIMNNVLKISDKLQSAGRSPSDFLVDNKVWGSLGSMAKQVQTGMSTENRIIGKAVSELDQAGDVLTPTYSELKNDAIAFLSDTKLGKLYNTKELQSLVDKVPLASVRDATNLSWKDLNATRSSLGSYLSDTKWLQTTPTETTQATKALYGALSDAIKGATGTDENFANYANWIEANKAIGKVLSKADKKWGIGLLDTLSAGTGAVIGTAFGAPTVGALAGASLERVASSPITKSGAAQLISKVPSVGGALGRTASALGLGKMIGQ